LPFSYTQKQFQQINENFITKRDTTDFRTYLSLNGRIISGSLPDCLESLSKLFERQPYLIRLEPEAFIFRIQSSAACLGLSNAEFIDNILISYPGFLDSTLLDKLPTIIKIAALYFGSEDKAKEELSQKYTMLRDSR
jgi:hypothetical protein